MQTEKAIINRLMNLKKLYAEHKSYPASFRVLGFPILHLDNKEELKGRIKELQELIGIEMQLTKEEELIPKPEEAKDLSVSEDNKKEVS